MEPIDISSNIADFKQVFEAESRMIFSAKFGDGKSYFLDKFIKSYPKEDNDYYFITLHPVNYVVEENKDVIEYIKRDILFQLIKDGKISDYKEVDYKIFNAVCNRESLTRLADFIASIIPVKGLKAGLDTAKKLLSTVKEKYEEQNDVKLAEDYLNGFYGLTGNISECDAFTCLIQNTLEYYHSKSVLIIEDLDRIDPAHLFRIMNVLSSQVDNPYYADSKNGNKFGFDKIILVMDYDITKHIFHHFYGNEANYEGYMNKFLNTIPFHYSIKEEVHRQVTNKLLSICKTEEVLNMDQTLSRDKKDRISVPLAINNLSVRRSKEFLDVHVDSLLRDRWLNDEYTIPTKTPWSLMLACYRFLMSDKSVGQIMEAMLYGFSDLQLAELAAPYNYARNGDSLFFMEVKCRYYKIKYTLNNVVTQELHRSEVKQDKLVTLSEIRKLMREIEYKISELLIG